MFFRKKEEELLRLNLEVPKEAPPRAAAPMPNDHLPMVDPVRLAAVQQRTQAILDSAELPEYAFLCTVQGNLLVLNPGGGRAPVLPLCLTSFAAVDYLRGSRVAGNVNLMKVERLPVAALEWISRGVGSAALNRCPRCPVYLTTELTEVAKWTTEDYRKIWANLRAARLVLGETRVRSALAHMASKNHAAARAEFEYVRDHFDCGVPYLHQLIGIIAGILGDAAAKAEAIERLKEFGSPFEGNLEVSGELLGKAMVGVMQYFGIVLRTPPEM